MGQNNEWTVTLTITDQKACETQGNMMTQTLVSVKAKTASSGRQKH